MAEWSIAAVLKTVELRGSGGSNPSLSAKKREQIAEPAICSLFVLKLMPPQYLTTSSERYCKGIEAFCFYTLVVYES